MEVERRSLRIFLFVSGFRTHIVATTVRATGVYTPSVSHAHFSDTLSLRGVQTSRTRMAQGVCSAHVVSTSPSPCSCFIRRLCCSTVTSTPRSRLHCPCRTVSDPKARVKRTSARVARSLATCPIPRTPHHGQWALLGTDTLVSIDRSACLVIDASSACFTVRSRFPS